MASANFKTALKHVLIYEGGYSNHPADPGGVTLEGVIQRVYDGYRKRKGRPQQPLKASMRNTAEWKKERDEIYREQYWNMIRGDEMPSGIDFVVFDGAVNSGPAQSAKWLQRALGVNPDGNIGEATLAAIKAHPNHDKLVADICGRRMAFLQQLKTFSTFGKGWSARVANVQATGQALASGKVVAVTAAAAVDKSPAEEGNAKASSADIAEAPVPVGAGTAGTTIGTLTTGTLDTLQTTSATLQPLSEGIQYVKYIVIGITLLIAAVTIYGVYRNYKAQRARNGEDSALVPDTETA